MGEKTENKPQVMGTQLEPCHLSSHTPLMFRDFTDKLREWSNLIEPVQACSCHHKLLCSHGARSVKL